MTAAAVRDVLSQKASSLQRCIGRAREEFHASPDFANNVTRQDAAILNVQRACELVIDMANIVINDKGWMLPESSRQGFEELLARGVIDQPAASTLARMVGFRNLAVHAYQKLDMAIVAAVITKELDTLPHVAAKLLDLYLTE
jgi:uncharacterized protein YutE (UPF0331/DUF86 family)